MHIGVILGSLRKDSLTRKMAYALMKLAPDVLDMEIISIEGLPVYNEDLDGEIPPQEWTAFRDHVRRVAGILFVTPEYNRSVPAVLKNAIDVGSAPDDCNVFNGKPTAIVSLSPGAMGAFGANHHLRQSLVFLNAPAMQQPEAYIGHSEQLFDDEGNLVRENTSAYLKKFMDAFSRWVTLHNNAMDNGLRFSSH